MSELRSERGLLQAAVSVYGRSGGSIIDRYSHFLLLIYIHCDVNCRHGSQGLLLPTITMVSCGYRGYCSVPFTYTISRDELLIQFYTLKCFLRPIFTARVFPPGISTLTKKTCFTA